MRPHDPPIVIFIAGLTFFIMGVTLLVAAVVMHRTDAQAEVEDTRGPRICGATGINCLALGAGIIAIAYTWSSYWPATASRDYWQNVITYLAFGLTVLAWTIALLPSIRSFFAELRLCRQSNYRVG